MRIETFMNKRNLFLSKSLGYGLVILCGSLTALLNQDASGESNSAARENEPMDVVPFGQIMHWDGEGKDYGVIWEDLRDIFRVVVTFDSGGDLPDTQSVRLEYWQSKWPQKRIPRDTPSGAGSSGWLDTGDWFQGRWQTADCQVEIQNNSFVFTFNSVNAKEFQDLGEFAAQYRTTMKLRIVADAPLPSIASFEAYTDSMWKSLEVEIFWGGTAEDPQVWDGNLEAFNGVSQSVSPISPDSHVTVNTDGAWTSTVQGAVDGIRARILYAERQALNSFDETVVTARTQKETFS
ncbi:MAG: hypothetical protein ABIH23_06830, partial [bacterium]